MKLPRYRVWAGFALWLGGTAIDAFLMRTGGWFSLSGFLLAFVWSWKAPR